MKQRMYNTFDKLKMLSWQKLYLTLVIVCCWYIIIWQDFFARVKVA